MLNPGALVEHKESGRPSAAAGSTQDGTRTVSPSDMTAAADASPKAGYKITGEREEADNTPAKKSAPAETPENSTPVKNTEEKEHKHEFSSTQFDINGREGAAVKRAAAKIPDSDLYTAESGYGREDHPHVTVKYGLHTNDAANLREALKDQPPVPVTLGKTSLFEGKGETPYDVVKVDVDSPELHALNAKIAAAEEHTDTHPEYKPHVTLAYVKKGLGAKYDGRSVDGVTGRTVKLDSLTFSDRDGKAVEIPLTGKGEENISPSASEEEPSPVQGADAQPTKAETRASVKTEKVDKRTGLTPTQEDYLAGELVKVADRHIEEAGAPDGAALRAKFAEDGGIPKQMLGAPMGEPTTIKVPGDGEFTVGSAQAANRLHQKITGQPIEGFERAKVASLLKTSSASGLREKSREPLLDEYVRSVGGPERALPALKNLHAQLESDPEYAKELGAEPYSVRQQLEGLRRSLDDKRSTEPVRRELLRDANEKIAGAESFGGLKEKVDAFVRKEAGRGKANQAYAEEQIARLTPEGYLTFEPTSPYSDSARKIAKSEIAQKQIAVAHESGVPVDHSGGGVDWFRLERQVKGDDAVDAAYFSQGKKAARPAESGAPETERTGERVAPASEVKGDKLGGVEFKRGQWLPPDFVYHNTSREAVDAIEREGMDQGSFSDRPIKFGGDSWIAVRRGDLPDPQEHTYGNAKAIEPSYEFKNYDNPDDPSAYSLGRHTIPADKFYLVDKKGRVIRQLGRQSKAEQGSEGAPSKRAAGLSITGKGTKADYDATKRQLLAKLSPDRLHDASDIASMLPDLARLGAYHVRNGAVAFKDFASRMIDDLGDGIRPHLKRVYLEAQKLVEGNYEQDVRSGDTESVGGAENSRDDRGDGSDVQGVDRGGRSVEHTQPPSADRGESAPQGEDDGRPAVEGRDVEKEASSPNAREGAEVESAEEQPHHSNFQPRDDDGTFVEGKPELPPTGAANAVTSDERAARGLSDVEKQAYQTLGESYTEGRRLVESGEIDPRALAQTISDKPRPLSASEVGALAYDRARLINDHRDAVSEIARAVDADDPLAVAKGKERLEQIEKAFDANDQALQKGGREQSAAFNARKVMVRDDYSLASVINRAKAKAGGEISEETRARLEDLSKKLEDAESALAKKDEELKRAKAARAVKRIQRDAERETRRTRRAATREQLDQEFADLKQQFAQARAEIRNTVQPSGLAGLDPEGKLTAIIARMARNRVRAGVVTLDGLVDEIHGHLSDVLDGLTKRDIRDAISGYGEERKSPERDEAASRLAELRRQMRDLSAREDGQLTQAERSRLPAAKKRLQKQIADLEEKIARGDFTKPGPRTPLVYDAEGEELKGRRDALRADIDREIRRLELQNRTKGQKLSDFILKARRAVLLSSVQTLGKLTAAAAGRAITTPTEEVIGGALSKLPGVRRVAEKAPREGGLNLHAEGAALRSLASRGMLREAKETLTGGSHTLAVRYGGKEHSEPEMLELFGRIHGALKSPAKYSEFFRAVEKRSAFEHDRLVKSGMTSDEAAEHLQRPDVQAAILGKAYEDASRAILMQDNAAVRLYKGLTRQMEAQGGVSKGAAKAAKFLLPIVKVPTNFVAESTDYAAGGLRALYAVRHGIDSLTPDQADAVIRSLKKQTVGAGLMTLGYLFPGNFGGYYQPGDNKDKRKPQAGTIRVAGHDLPRWLAHSPALEALQIGATVRHVVDAERKKRGESPVASGLYQAGKG
ncbi:MAG: 2'-5' RNA ligase family protein, partial [Acidobacteriota bacterium]|nr:2'-5' RNA ligase family protein [Acidobacteriota bacterium]